MTIYEFLKDNRIIEDGQMNFDFFSDTDRDGVEEILKTCFGIREIFDWGFDVDKTVFAKSAILALFVEKSFEYSVYSKTVDANFDILNDYERTSKTETTGSNDRQSNVSSTSSSEDSSNGSTTDNSTDQFEKSAFDSGLAVDNKTTGNRTNSTNTDSSSSGSSTTTSSDNDESESTSETNESGRNVPIATALERARDSARFSYLLTVAQDIANRISYSLIF